MKTINVDAYKVIKKHEENSLYDVLLCNICAQSCMRCNFSRHKKSPKHLRELQKEQIPDISYILGKTPEPNHKTFSLLADDTEDTEKLINYEPENTIPPHTFVNLCI
jgi:hypothetical protein